MTIPASVLASETHHLTSAAGREYRITVALPLAYATAPDDGWPLDAAPSSWPTVYVLDGNWYFGLVTDMIRPMSWCGGTSDAIVVGIGYEEGDDPREAFRAALTRRNLDLTPTRDPAGEQSLARRFDQPVPTGGAKTFSDFIVSELTPFIEKRYRADASRRMLIGHSYGGLFAAYSLFKAPGHFASYVIGSPTLAYGDRSVFQQEERFAGDNDALPARVFFYAGDEEFVDDTTLTDTIRFVTILRSRNYESLELATRYFPDYDHCAVAAPGIHAGLNFALAKRRIDD